jgi:hypothetical protein
MNLTKEELQLAALSDKMADELVCAVADIAERYVNDVPEAHRAYFLATAICLTLSDLFEGREEWLIKYWRSILEMADKISDGPMQ